MKRSFPAPPVRLFVGKARVLMPTFVEELVWTIRQIAPSQRGDGVDHLPEFGLRVLDLIQRLPASVGVQWRYERCGPPPRSIEALDYSGSAAPNRICTRTREPLQILR